MIPKVDLFALLSDENTHPLFIWMLDFLDTGPAR